MTSFLLRLFLFAYLLITAADLLLMNDRRESKPVPKSPAEALAKGDWPYTKDQKMVTPCAPITECEAKEFTW